MRWKGCLCAFVSNVSLVIWLCCSLLAWLLDCWCVCVCVCVDRSDERIERRGEKEKGSERKIAKKSEKGGRNAYRFCVLETQTMSHSHLTPKGSQWFRWHMIRYDRSAPITQLQQQRCWGLFSVSTGDGELNLPRTRSADCLGLQLCPPVLCHVRACSARSPVRAETKKKTLNNLCLSLSVVHQDQLSVNPTKISRSVRREQGATGGWICSSISSSLLDQNHQTGSISFLILNLKLTSSWGAAMSCFEFDPVQCRAGIQTAQRKGLGVASCLYPMVVHGKSLVLSAEQTHHRHCIGAGAQSFGPCGFHIKQEQLYQKKVRDFLTNEENTSTHHPCNYLSFGQGIKSIRGS